MRLAPDVDKARREVAAAEERLARLRRLLEIVRNENWKLIDDWIEVQQQLKLKGLATPETPATRTEFLRGEYSALQAFRRLPDATEQDMRLLSDRIGDLRAKLEQWHTAGRTATAKE